MAVTFEIVGDIVKFNGLSSDTKPTTYQAPGGTDAVPIDSTFDETDGIKVRSRFNGDSWVEIGINGASPTKEQGFTVTGDSQTISLGTTATGYALGSGVSSVAITNTHATQHLWINWGTSQVDAETNVGTTGSETGDMIPAGKREQFAVPAGKTYFALIASGAATTGNAAQGK